MPCIIYVIKETIADQTDHFSGVFVPENVAYDYDVMTTPGVS